MNSIFDMLSLRHLWDLSKNVCWAGGSKSWAIRRDEDGGLGGADTYVGLGTFVVGEVAEKCVDKEEKRALLVRTLV